MPALLPRLALAGLVGLAVALVPAVAAAAPSISGSDDKVWNAAEGPPTYEIRNNGAFRWRVVGVEAFPWRTVRSSPFVVTLDGIADGRFTLRAETRGERTDRTFSVDTREPVITVSAPAAGATYQLGQQIAADFRCSGHETCTGTVADGAAIDTATTGTKVFTVTATDAAGNTAEERVEYKVAAAPTPPSAPPASSGPEAPSPTIRIAQTPGDDPADQGPAPPTTRNATALTPDAGTTLSGRRPVLSWTRVGFTRLYNLQVYRVGDGSATKVLSVFPRGTRYRVPRGALTFGSRYVWRVWPLVKGSYPAVPHGLSWFDVERPVRLTARQLLINQRISQAALRRLDAVSDWLDEGLATGDLRDGGLGRTDFGADVRLSGAGDPIDNGVADPRPLVTAAATRSGSSRLVVSARQLLVNQRISQAAVRRANALESRLGGGLTGGDLRPGAVSAIKLAPGLQIDSAPPAGPGPAASTTTIATASRTGRARVRLTDGQTLINQRISQAAVRRANALRALIEGGLTGANFRDGAVTAVSVAPDLR